MSADLEKTIESALDDVLGPKTEEIRRELAERLHDQWRAVDERREETIQQAREEMAAALAAAVRRIRGADSVTAVAHALAEEAARFCGRVGLFIVRDDRLLGFRVAGEAGEELQRSFERVDLALTEALAIAHAADTCDGVVTGGSRNELSQRIVELFGLAPSDRVHLFPVVLRDKALAILYADGGSRARRVEAVAIETLACAAEAWIEAVGSRRKPAPVREEATV